MYLSMRLFGTIWVAIQRAAAVARIRRRNFMREAYFRARRAASIVMSSERSTPAAWADTAA